MSDRYTSSARQVATLSSFKAGKNEPPHVVTTQKRNGGTEVKCDCPVYRCNIYCSSIK